MVRSTVTLLLVHALPSLAAAAPPPQLAAALEQLREQKSYSWEMINLDPGPVTQNIETRRGTVTTVLVSNSPNVKGSIDLNGDSLLVREWSDGLKLETFITAKGDMVTNTPEGWLTSQEILTAQADERMRADTPTERFLWLRRADRPDVRRPDEELLPMLKSSVKFEETANDIFVAHGQIKASGAGKTDEEDGPPPYEVTITMHVRGGVIRDYEVNIEGNRRMGRSRVSLPVSDHRSVILTHVPIARVKVPPEAREKLKPAKSAR